MSIEDHDKSKIEQQKLEQQETDKPKTGKQALDIVKAQKERKEITKNLENLKSKPKTGKEALDLVKQELKAQKADEVRRNAEQTFSKAQGKTEKDSLKNEAETNDLTSDARFDKNWRQYWQNHSNPVVRDRFETAQNFYKEAGYNNDKALQEMKGINFNREVSIETIKPDESLIQYQYPEANREGKMGSYFTKDSDKSELGIQGDSLLNQNRVPELYVTNKEIQVLKSTSFDVENWTENKELNYGGGTQYFVAEKDKGSLSLWNHYIGDKLRKN